MERTTTRMSLVVALLGICSGIGAAAQAQTPQVPVAAVDYRAPDACIDRRGFEDLVAARLGYVGFRDDAPRRLIVTLSEGSHGFDGMLREEGSDAAGQSVSGASCDRVAEATAMLVAIAIDPLGEGAAATAERPREALDPVLAALDDEAPPEPQPRPPAGPVAAEGASAHVSIGASVVGSAGLAPSPTLGGGLDVALHLGVVSLALEATVETTPIAGVVQGADLDATAWHAGIVPCLSQGALTGCAVVQIGQLYVSSDELAEPSSGDAFVAHAGGRLGLGVEAVGLRWGGRIDVVTPVVRPSVELGGATAWSAPSLAVRLGLSVSWVAR